MRIAPLFIFAATSWSQQQFGAWKMVPERSTAPWAGSITVRFEPHLKGEVFTVDIWSADGRLETVSTILYFDEKPRKLDQKTCSGTQFSRRVDDRTVEIVKECASGQRIRIVRRLPPNSRELILDISEASTDATVLARRLVLAKE